MWWALSTTPSSRWYGAIQSTVCHQDSTSKLLVVLLCVIIVRPIFVSRASSCCIKTSPRRSFIVKCRNTQESARTPLWQTCKALCPWVLFHETMLTTRITNLLLLKLQLSNFLFPNNYMYPQGRIRTVARERALTICMQDCIHKQNTLQFYYTKTIYAWH